MESYCVGIRNVGSDGKIFSCSILINNVHNLTCELHTRTLAVLDKAI